jgi:hypothetical protein
MQIQCFDFYQIFNFDYHIVLIEFYFNLNFSLI